MYPKTFQNLIKHFSSLPSVGPKMAERLVLFLFKQDKELIDEFSADLLKLKELRICQRCYNVAESDLCSICQDNKRDHHTICVVEDALDVLSLERIRSYRGLYHVLGGTIEQAGGDNLKIPELLDRIRSEKIEEVIIATNPTTEGDTTALYLKRKISSLGISVTRLGRGMATGGDIEYADEMTLTSALSNRQKIL